MEHCSQLVVARSPHCCCCCLCLSSVPIVCAPIAERVKVGCRGGCYPCKKHEESYVRKENKITPHEETPENRLIHSRTKKKKKNELPPREIQCSSDRAQTSIIVSGRASRAKSTSFPQTARARREMVDQIDKQTKKSQ